MRSLTIWLLSVLLILFQLSHARGAGFQLLQSGQSRHAECIESTERVLNEGGSEHKHGSRTINIDNDDVGEEGGEDNDDIREGEEGNDDIAEGEEGNTDDDDDDSGKGDSIGDSEVSASHKNAAYITISVVAVIICLMAAIVAVFCTRHHLRTGFFELIRSPANLSAAYDNWKVARRRRSAQVVCGPFPVLSTEGPSIQYLGSAVRCTYSESDDGFNVPIADIVLDDPSPQISSPEEVAICLFGSLLSRQHAIPITQDPGSSAL